MEELKITYPMNPFQTIANNRWQLCTYTVGAHMLGWKNGRAMRNEYQRNAFSFYSIKLRTYYIMYNDRIRDFDFLNFLLAHEIGHVFYYHIGPHRTMLPNKEELRMPEDIMANLFAQFALGMTGGKWLFPKADPRTYERPQITKQGRETADNGQQQSL